MKYVEFCCVVSNPTEDILDILVAELAELGYDSFNTEGSTLKAYIPEVAFDGNSSAAIVNKYLSADGVTISWEPMPDKNWNEVWESNFEPIIIEDKCTIRAPFHTNLPKTTYEIVIEPKMSFGTGHHATTYQMVEFVLANEFKGLRVLDMGCGTGILAILAAMRGASDVLAIDNDDWAFQNAEENVQRNASGKVRVALGDANLLGAETFDVILANINRNILLADMSRYVDVLKNDGLLFLSGILIVDIPIISECAIGLGLTLLEQKDRSGWVALSFKK
ncbi:50S ribosomal protein L11 methyltransferase [Williamwhitmania taraxaci]|uniref:Ribosomal protein L11 methyltransferase n=1 Tax=Williamwhitmania taraxaci TaxID=1640674 RepID=A0A1G6JB98_9BACT|nr:50S ribosomal protein L11 methyltransferase [Williamwhitmania taraxaci]SDC15913.1 ribosomal protein L11 methyltransferase [Williamwhitmania taraxaci]